MATEPSIETPEVRAAVITPRYDDYYRALVRDLSKVLDESKKTNFPIAIHSIGAKDFSFAKVIEVAQSSEVRIGLVRVIKEGAGSFVIDDGETALIKLLALLPPTNTRLCILLETWGHQISRRDVGSLNLRCRELGFHGEISVSNFVSEVFDNIGMFLASYHFTRSERSTLELPSPGAGPHFGLGPTGRVASISRENLDVSGNNVGRINQLLPLVRECVEDLLTRSISLANQHPALLRDVNRYRQLVAADREHIQWGTLWGIGVRLDTAAAAAERRVADRMAPELEDEPLAALQSLRNLHAPLILATTEGKELQELADHQLMSREQQAEFHQNASVIAAALTVDEDVIESAAAAVAQEAIDTIGAEPHPERGTTYGTATIKNLSIVVVAAAVAATPGFGSQNLAGVAATMGVWEVLKKWPTFAKAAEQLGKDIDENLAQDAVLVRNVVQRLTPFRSFIVRQEQPLRAIASTTSQLKWLLPYIDFIVRTSPPGGSVRNLGQAVCV